MCGGNLGFPNVRFGKLPTAQDQTPMQKPFWDGDRGL